MKDLPKVFTDWIAENTDSPFVNNSRRIMTRKLHFLYNKFHKSKNEYWATQIENITGIGCDYKNTDSVAND
jgi:hypothetical protein